MPVGSARAQGIRLQREQTPTSHQHAVVQPQERGTHVIGPNQRHRLQQAILEGASCRLAQEDVEFLAQGDLLPLRVHLELLKPEHALRAQGIGSTVVVFGSARIQAPDDGAAQAAPTSREEASVQARAQAQARLYEEARRFAQIVSTRLRQEGRCDFVVVTGGGPGIMEAANRGAFEAGARSIGFNITLPHEQAPNPYITPELAFRFHYFALRKMHFLLRAKALVAFPGGYGTLDELFEVLTLVQTGKIARIPIVLVGTEFWRRSVDFAYLVDQGFIDAQDTALFTVVDAADEIVSTIEAFYAGKPPGAQA